ncbi:MULTISPECIES: hypothetical protein [unclassified Rhodococcus (in: high G+C Gram-positive bacteria)]|uniref:hypothetical protein n=1 Tax=unclassified Rhodococcus (in: high G+C Gram-positive bacteria) TaxID=192944 RepID=UPI00146E9428|nr:hypothetical protein [Rhodococcus sp. (in: high G+C Gram-positive bacteria)]NMD94492.1 hypothetical protein [Rhodococcus sp. BL-253-APC-6A1W]NME78375.1 hypothetical protein [Rhodococcus sp. 105337]
MPPERRVPSRAVRASRGVPSARVATVAALLWARLWGAAVTFDDECGIYVCAGMRGGFARGGTTVGGAFLTRAQPTRRLLRHEAVHADQWARYGLGFAVRYWWEEIRNPGSRNRFEIEAGLEDGGYRKITRPGAR